MRLTKWFLNFDFNGRARRSHTWANWLAWIGVWIVVWMIVSALGGFNQEPSMTRVAAENGVQAYVAGPTPHEEASGPGFLALAILFVTWVLALIDSVAMTFRRAHDTGKTGWVWLLLLIPLVNLLPLYWLLIEDSQQGPNKYGPSVKDFYEPASV